jgi:subtilisin family serine protease
MMIGANDGDNNIADFSQFPSDTVTIGRGKNQRTETDDGYGVEVSAGGVNTLSTFPAGTGGSSTVTVDGTGYASLGMENFGTASGSTYFMGIGDSTDAGANGKICVIDRGTISFHDKVLNCENSGGIGAIIVNNVSGVVAGTLGSPNSTTIPAAGTALEDRASIVNSSTATVSVQATDYAFLSGTSMATPTAAGAAALIWSNHPTCTGTEIRQAMKDTAEDQGAAGRDDFFGYGIVKAKAASDHLTANPCGGTPPTGDITLSGNRSKGGRQANLSWSGATGSTVDIYVNGSFNVNTANDGSAAFTVTKNVPVTFAVCEAGSTTTCSDDLTL